MSEKYGNPCATYNIPLNISENDIFRIGRAHLQHFIQVNVKTDNCKPMMLKMHLELDDHPPSIGEAEERNIVHNSSNNGLRQSIQQHEEEIKALKVALLQAKENDEVNPNNGLRDSVQQLELEMKALKDTLLQAKEDDDRIDKAPDVDNNATQESNSNKQVNNGNNLSGEHNDTENVASASEGHHTNTMPEEKPEVIDLRDNCVYIQNFQCSDSGLEKAFYNVRKLANEMNVKIPDDSVIHIEVQPYSISKLNYFVYFCNADIKEEFLKNRHFLKYHPETSPLRIFDYSEWGIVEIKDFRSSDLSLEAAYVNVMGIAERMGISDDWNIRSSIDHIDVYVSTNPNFLNYSVRFTREFMRTEFLSRKYLLKQFPETKSLEISGAGGHRLRFIEVDEVSVTVASANVIGLAELIGLSLAPDNLKRIYVLNYVPYVFNNRELSLIVEFSSKQVKDEFLEKNNKLEEKECLTISDINAKKNIVLIEYSYIHVATAISFIGLAKQLGFSLNPDQIQNFYDLSKFIDNTRRRK